MLEDRVLGCIFTRCKHPDCFPILHVREVYFEALFLMILVSMLCIGCYIKQMKSIQFFNPSSIIYVGAQVNFSAIANIYWLKPTFKYQSNGFRVHFKSILVYNWKTKSGFWSKCPHYIMGYKTNLGSIFFLLSMVLDLAYIDYSSLCQIWNVYMQYLRWCDFLNKYLFLVIQQAEVLLNFWWV